MAWSGNRLRQPAKCYTEHEKTSFVLASSTRFNLYRAS
jgi:hypothetical protein